MELRPVQDEALRVAANTGRLFGSIGVGHGKTLICALLPEALRAKRALLLLPGSAVPATSALRATYGRLPPCRILTYEALQQPHNRHILRELRPDAIIMDEAHAACGQTSTRSRRIVEYLRANQGTAVCALSGTLMKLPLDRAARCGAWVWGKLSPLPTTNRDALSLARVIDGEGSAREIAQWCKAYASTRSRLLENVRRKVEATPGAVFAQGLSVDCSIVVEKLEYTLSQAVLSNLDTLDKTWELEGAIYADAMHVASVRRQLATGFYYRWATAPPADWLEARRAWSKAMRSYLRMPRAYDSEGLVTAAMLRGERLSKELTEAWEQWGKLRDMDAPDTEPVWLDRTLAQRAGELAKHQGALLWCTHRAFGEAAGVPVIAPKHNPEGGAAAVSVAAHGTGRNLQAYSRNVFPAPLLNAGEWEQVLGRTHRQGQQADEVTASVFVSSVNAEDWEASIEKSKADRKASGVEQRLLLGLGQ